MKSIIASILLAAAAVAGETNIVALSDGRTLQGLSYTMPVCLFLGPLSENVRAEIHISTNVVTEWHTLTKEKEQPKLTLEDLAVNIDESGVNNGDRTTWGGGMTFRDSVLRYKTVQQIGTVVTNRVMKVLHSGRTQEIVLAELGRDAWPSRKRTITLHDN